MTTPRTALALAAALAALSTSACSFTGTASAGPTSPSPGATSSARTTTTRTPAAGPAPASPTASHPAAHSSSSTSASHASSPGTTTRTASGSGAGNPRCALGQLQVALTGAEGAAGSVYATITFRNTGAVCHLLGRPGVDGIRSDGHVVHAARTDPGHAGSATPTTVVLKPGGHASFTLRAQNVPSGTATSCPPRFTTLLVTPPDLRASARVSADLPACGPLGVGPVVPGVQG